MATFTTNRRLLKLESLASEQRPVLSAWEQTWGWLVMHRVPLSTGIFALLLLHALCTDVRPRSIAEPWGTAGAVLFLGGLGLRSWAAGTLHKDSGLTTTGPYALCRHPLYLGSYLLMSGFAILIPDPGSAGVILGPVLLLYHLTIRLEETGLAARFKGAWARYVSRVALLFPLRRPARIGSGWSFQRWHQNREHVTVGSSLLLLGAVETWRILTG